MSIENQIQLPSAISFCLDSLHTHGFEAFLVGGAVRNYLLQKESVDFDITTNATPTEVKFVFSEYPTLDTGIKNGTITLLLQNESIEITTYRTEQYSNNHRSPVSVTFGTSLKEDCQRRDFTINALCFSQETGIIDFFDGVSDIEDKVVRCIGNPHERFEEDALRILRALRFSAQLNFQVEESTHQALLDQKELLHYLSKERITSEIKKILRAPFCIDVLIQFRTIIITLFPELAPISYPTAVSLLKGSPLHFPTRFALLLTALDQENQNTILTRLSLSKKDINTIRFLLKNQSNPCQNKSDIKQLLRDNPQDTPYFLPFKKAIDPTLNLDYTQELLQSIKRNKECFSLSQLAINGETLIALDFPRENFSTLLNDCLDQVISETLPNQEEALIDYLYKKNPSL